VSEASDDVTALLVRWRAGSPEAEEQLMAKVLGELRRLAASYLRRERAGHTLQPTAVVNEAYMRLVPQRGIHWENRAHFFGIAARMMRRVLVDHARTETPVVLLDFHAEATSEKVAMAHWLDGRVTAVIGTHTHVQTNDARVLPGGTAAITDAGMTGPHDSVIGVKAELAIRRMRTRLPVRFEPADGGVRIEGVVVDCSDDGRATGIELLRIPL